MNNIAIQFKNVTKVYKLFKNDKQRFRAIFSKRVKPKIKKAINEVSFTVERGESVALFGRNGAGKSTILKMITGVTYPTKGEIIVDGRVSALLELTAGFDPDFTGRENIFFRGQLLGISDEEIRELEDEIIEFADLGDYIDQPVRTYSSGMKARLGFGINANIKPEILIVDEALSVTHSTNVAKSFCKRGIVMKAGKLVYDGDIEDAIQFYEDMVDKEVAAKKKKGSNKVLG